MSEFVDSVGTKIVNVHHPSACEGYGCPIHHPSDHHMKDWPLVWRTGIEDYAILGPIEAALAGALGGPGWFERTCPHGVGHPDPDDRRYQVEYLERVGMGTHSCDGCCVPTAGGVDAEDE